MTSRFASAQLPSRDRLLRAIVIAGVVGLALGLLTALHPLVAGLIGLVVAAADAAVARRQRVPSYSPTPGRLRLAAWAVLLVAAIPIVAYVQERHTTSELKSNLEAATGTIGGLRTSMPPAGFAAHCFDLYVSAGGPVSATRFTDACNPGIDTSDLEKQQVNVLQATGTTPVLGPGLSYPDPERPNYYSVLLATHLRAWDSNGAKPGAWKDLGPAYFRVAVAVDDTGAPALRGLPRQVAAPVTSEVPDLSGGLSEATLDDPKTAMLNEFFSRFLVAPPDDRPHDGDVGQYVAPSAGEAVVVHSPLVARTSVLKTAYVPRDGSNLTDALAVVKVTYKGGSSSIQTYPLVLVQSGTDQWQILSMPGTPPLQS